MSVQGGSQSGVRPRRISPVSLSLPHRRRSQVKEEKGSIYYKKLSESLEDLGNCDFQVARGHVESMFCLFNAEAHFDELPALL